MYIITNGLIVTPKEVLKGYDLVIEAETIVDLCITLQNPYYKQAESVIDAQSGYILPGFIDMHSDYIEHMAAPRPTSLMNFEMALYEAERELLSHGITTMYHSLSLIAQKNFAHKPIREQDNVLNFVELIHKTHTSSHLIHHKFHLRYEIDNLAAYDLVETLIAKKAVHLLSFMDHTPLQGQYRNLEIYQQNIQAQHRTQSEVKEMIEKHINTPKASFEQLKSLANLAGKHNIPLASHDDDTTAKLVLVHELGSIISEFPVTLEVALDAQSRGMYTVGGAPNILLGKSHSGNLSIKEAIRYQAIDIICSDYYPAALLHSVFQLYRENILDLPDAVKLVTLNPAEALGLAQETGSLEIGQRADIIIVEMIQKHIPAVTKTFVRGVKVNETTYRN